MLEALKLSVINVPAVELLPFFFFFVFCFKEFYFVLESSFVVFKDYAIEEHANKV